MSSRLRRSPCRLLPRRAGGQSTLHRRHLRTAELKPAGDYLTGRRTLLVNRHLHIGVTKPVAPPERFFSNGDGDELYFVDAGSGFVDSVLRRSAVP